MKLRVGTGEVILDAAFKGKLSSPGCQHNLIFGFLNTALPGLIDSEAHVVLCLK